MIGIVATLTLAIIGQRSPEPRVYTLKGQAHGHSYVVRFEQTRFQTHGRKIVWIRFKDENKNEQQTFKTYMPGFQTKSGKSIFWGWPDIEYKEMVRRNAAKALRERNTEIAALRVAVDGESWPINQILYRDLLDPDLGNTYVQASISHDGKVLKVVMMGSDGAGSYEARWTFRSTGKHDRSIDFKD